MSRDDDRTIDPSSLETPAEPLRRTQQASPFPLQWRFAMLLVFVATMGFVIFAVGANHTLTTQAHGNAPAPVPTAPILPGGDSTLGEAITNATPRPAGVRAPIGGGEHAPVGDPSPASDQGGDQDLSREIANAKHDANDDVVVPPAQTVTAPPVQTQTVPGPQTTPPQTSLGRAPQATDSGDETLPERSADHEPTTQTAIVSGGLSNRAQEPAPSTQATSGLQTVNPNDAIVAKRLAFNTSAGAAPGYLSSRIHDPLSQYEIFVKTPVRMQLDDNIRTAVPGDCYAHNIDGVRGSLPPYPLLIPPGTTFQCRYSSSTITGDKQVQIALDTMKFADGRTFDLGGMPGEDNSGEAGLTASGVDDHRGRIFTTTLLSAVFDGALAAAAPASNLLNANPVAAAAGTVATSGAETAKQIINQQVQQGPTLYVERGRLFTVRLRSTIIIEPKDPSGE